MTASDDAFANSLTDILGTWEIHISTDQLSVLQKHYLAMVETNRSFNLTRITDPYEAAIKHYADSLALLLWTDQEECKIERVLDIGTGAGFPSLPIAVMRPEWSVTAIDATKKKIDFVARTAASLGVPNLHCEHAHSEHWASSNNRFDLVLCRALSKPTKAIELAGGFVGAGGYLVAYQSDRVDPFEQRTAQQLATTFHLSCHQPFPYELNCNGEQIKRILQIYKKGSAIRIR